MNVFHGHEERERESNNSKPNKWKIATLSLVGILLILFFVPLGKADLSLGNYVIQLILQENQTQDPFTIKNATGSTLLKIDANSTLTINDASGNPSTVVGPRSGVEAASYIIFTDGTNVYAKNGTTGKIDFSGTDAATVIQSTLDALNYGTISIRKGTYELRNKIGIVISKSNLNLIGEEGTNLRQNFSGSPTQILDIYGAQNITIANIAFDQDRNNTNQVVNESVGYQWVVRASGSNIKIYNVKILNGLENGIVAGSTDGLTIKDSFFDNFGESPIYFTGANKTVFENNKVYNWGKKYRGYFKIADSTDVVIRDIYAESNRDGRGFEVSADWGAHGLLLTNGNRVYVDNFVIVGNGTPGQNTGIYISGTGNNNIIVDVLKSINHGQIVFQNANISTNYYELKNSLIVNASDMGSLPSVIDGVYFIDPGTLQYIGNDNAVIRNSIFKRVNKTHNYDLLDIRSKNILIDNVQFLNWTYRIIMNNIGIGSTDATIKNCYFSGGVTSSAISFGTRTLVDGCVWGNDTATGAYAVSSSGGVDTIFINNRIPSSLVVDILPTTFKYIENNIGYVTKNKNTTSIANGGTIAHGLATTPTSWYVFPQVANVTASATASSTQLTVSLIYINGTAVTTPINVTWRAEV